MSCPLIIARGPRALEAQLVADVAADQRALRDDVSRLGAPLRVLVSSGPLRAHVAATLARESGPAVLGVVVQTLWGAAREVLERAGDEPPAGSALFEVIARRAAAAQPDLERLLAPLDDGYGVVSETLRDFLSAGLDGEVAAQLETLAQREIRSDVLRARAVALIRAAARCERDMRAAGVGRSTDLLAFAAARLAGDGDEGGGARGAALLPARALLVVGFSDATGQAVRLIDTLRRTHDAQVYLHRPPDPARPERDDRGGLFLERLLRRLGGETREAEQHAPPATISVFDASGADGEVREVVYRVRELMREGVAPERIGITSRELSSYAVPLRRHLRALGVPCSGGAAPAALFPWQRRLRAALIVLERGAMAPAESWLDALAATSWPVEDLSLALRAVGAARLGDVAGLDIDRLLGGRDVLRLPSRQGLAAADDVSAGRRVQARRELAAPVLRQAVGAAQRLLETLDAWPQRATVALHVAQVRALCAEQLAWPAQTPGGGERPPEWLEALAQLTLAGGSFEVTRDEAMLLLAGEVQELGAGALGGSGGGVQLLDAAHARGLTFEALFVLGANRDRFPRIVREDALLPDTARAALLGALPDLPLKRRGFDEERYLFAELCDSAPRVTLSWQRADDDGKALSVSPLVERLRLARGDGDGDEAGVGVGVGAGAGDGADAGAPRSAAAEALVRVPRLRANALVAPFAGGEVRPRTARDLLQLAGLAGGRERLLDLLGLAFEHGAGLAREQAIELAEARAQIIEELDPDLRTRDGRRRRRLPAPYFGLIGGALPDGVVGASAGPVYVTTLEQLARCPWQTFLSRVMRLEPPPDPLAALPTIDALLLGTTVHRVLDQLVGSGPAGDGEASRSLPEALSRGPRSTRRPDDAAVGERCRAVAREVALEAGLHLPGLHGALAALAEPYVMRALEVDWPLRRSRVDVLGGELEVVAAISDTAGGARQVACKADRVDLVRGSPRITDYKTGRPLSRGKRSSTRHGHLRRAVAGGRALQAAAYACAAEGDGAGRYLYVRPDLDARISELSLAADDEVACELFPRVAAELLAGFEEGAFFPRLEDERGEEPRSCSYCRVADACLRGDSSARRRLAEIVERAGEEGLAAGPLERRLRVLWRLGLEDEA